MRQLAHFLQGDELAAVSDQGRHYGQHIQPVTDSHPANCILSLTEDGRHMPILDDDQGLFRVIPSRTPGHNHVYIDKAIDWDSWVELLSLLARLELVDPKWARLSIDQGAATLRLPPHELMGRARG